MRLLQYIIIGIAAITTSVSAQTKTTSNLLIANQAIIIGENQQVVVTMDITLPSEMKISSNEALTITPVLKEKEGNQVKELPAIWIYGRTREIIQRRGNDIPKDAYTTMRRNNGKDQIIEYSTRLNYETWMYGSDLYLLNELYGCAECLKEENDLYVTNAYLER